MQFLGERPPSEYMVEPKSENIVFLNRCLKGKKWNKKLILIAALLSVFWNLFFYKTCVAFYNDEIGYTSNFFGPAINTYWARWL